MNKNYYQNYYQLNKQYFKEKNKKAYELDKALAKARQKLWRAENAEKYKAYQKAYREKKKLAAN